MKNRFVSIIGFGLIGEDRSGGLFRQVVFRDPESLLTADFLVYKKVKPMLWTDIEKMERGGRVPPYRGFIMKYNNVNLVILGEESPEQALCRQQYKLKRMAKISMEEAERMRKSCQGYITDLTKSGTMEMGWNEINRQAKRVQFRKYAGNGIFNWTGWYEIV